VREFSTGAEEVVRRPQHLGWTFSECIAIHINMVGERHVVVGDNVLSTRPGEIYLHDLNAPARYYTPTSLHTLAVFLPYTAIGYDPSCHPTSLSISMATPVGQMLLSAVRTTYQEAKRLRQADAPALAAGFCGLVRGLIMPDSSDYSSINEVNSARLNLIKSYIENHLHDPELDTTRLCQVFGASRATIYRLFAPEGGVTKYVCERRLVHAFRQLRSTPAERGRVKCVAESLGFNDHSHFNRLFRRKYNIAPSDAMGLWIELPTA
jgi:AraC-like DNA-binding protein